MLRARKLTSTALTACLVAMGGIGTTVLSAGAADAAACPTAGQIVTDINSAAAVAGDVNAQLGALTKYSDAGAVQSTAQATNNGFATIISDFNDDADALSGCPALSTANSKTVATAFASLATTITQTLSALTDDQPVFAQFGLTAPINSSLQSLEAAFDSYAYALVAVAASQQGPIAANQNSVDNSLGNAITTYSQLCIPSPLYPNLLPICVAL